jgi:predicted nucleic acid-binding Zn ribbon protein
MMSFRAKKTHEVLKGVLKNLNLDRKQSETEILKVWNRLIDPTITKHAQPTGLHQGTLFVKVDSSVWLSEIVRYHRKEILDRLQHSFGSDLITRISFSLG